MLVTVGTGIFTDLFLYSIIVPIIPFILEDRLGVARSNIQTYTSALLASWAGASFLSSPPIGILADRTASRKLLYMFGIGCLFLGTGLLWAGQAIWVLILARVVQAISGSVVYIVGLSLLVDTIGSNNLGMALGTIFSIVEISQLIAPVIGGSLYAVGGEASVFGLTFGILALDFLMRLLLIDRKTAAKFQVAPTIPSEGLSEPSLAVTSEPEPSLEVLNQPVPSETTPLVASTCSAEWIIAYPPAWIKTFPMGYCIRNPRMIAALATTFAQGSLISMFEATMTIEAQELFDVNSLKAGLLFIPLVLPSLVTGPFSGRMMDKFGPKPTAVAGFLWVSIALLLFRIPGPGDIGLFCGFLALTGGGLGMIGTPSILGRYSNLCIAIDIVYGHY